jgi:outer membrane protein assembly factor BamB
MRCKTTRLMFLMLLSISWHLAIEWTRADDAATIVRESGIRGGLVVHAGCGDGARTMGLRVDDKCLVQGLETDGLLVDRGQRRLLEEGQLGPVSIRHWNGGRLPYAGNLVNLLIVERGIEVPNEEILRSLAPGGVARLGRDGGWETLTKPWPTDIDEWTHFLHGPDNNAVANDTQVAPPQHLQWTAGPRWGRSHDQLASVSAVVSSGGRIFSIVDEGAVSSVHEPARWFLVARDAFNGIQLWKRPVSPWEDHMRPFRSGPAELPRRLVAEEERIYVTLGYGKPVTALDAATGETIRTYSETEDAQEILLCDGKLYVVAGELRSTIDGTSVPELPEWLVPYPQWVYEQGPKRLICVDAGTGEVEWAREDDETTNVLPLTLAAAESRLFFHNEKTLVAADAKTGETVWQADRPVSLDRYAWSSPTLVVSDGVVLSGDRTAEEMMDFGEREGRTPRWLVSSGHDLFGGEIVAFSAETGEKLWTAPCHESFNAPVDVFVARGQVWSGEVAWNPQPGITQVYDLKTGEVVSKRPPDQEFGRFGHHRCYRAKATVNYVLHSRRGIEFVDMDSDQLLIDRWTRGTCGYGLLPCNGMIYTPPHACACFVTEQLNGFNALRAKAESGGGRAEEGSSLLEGPAYGLACFSSGSGGWPTYRKDGARSGATKEVLSSELTRGWSLKLGGELTAPVVADGKVFVAQRDTNTVYAVDAYDGKRLWHYSVAAPVDSPPTVCDGRVVFGSADGRVYCLRAADGALAWQRRVAPEASQIVSYGRVESKWPVHGSLLVVPSGGADLTVCGVAGRSVYVDGGMVLFGLDAVTGDVRFERRLYQPSPQMKAREKTVSDGTFRVSVLPDILSTDGSQLFMRNQAFLLDGTPTKKKVPHLYSSAGFLDDSWWHRTYWQYGADMSSGYGGWISAGNSRISGRILVQRGDRIFGFGRKEYRKSGSHVGLDAEHHLFSAKVPTVVEPLQRRRGETAEGSARVEYAWSVEIPFFVRAIVLAGDTLFTAGPSKIVDLDAERPEGDVWLFSHSAIDGRKLSEVRLPVAPVFDSFAVSDGCLYMTTVDGKVGCYQ